MEGGERESAVYDVYVIINEMCKYLDGGLC